MRYCKRCVMREQPPRVQLDDEGVCNLCREHDAAASAAPQRVEAVETGLEVLRRKVEPHRAKTPRGYDCAVSISGGKDSVMTLYIARTMLELKPLAIFVDNGFVCTEMYQNVLNAVDVLGVDLAVFRTARAKELLKTLLQTKLPIYYCRLCHALLDEAIFQTVVKHGITLVLGGYTKGQRYLKNRELFWIYAASDKNVKDALRDRPEYQDVAEMFPSLLDHFGRTYGHITKLSPFWYLDYDDEAILKVLADKVHFRLPARSWPRESANCDFNYVSQFLGRRFFGYTQHEVELSRLVREGEMSRAKALSLVETPITAEDLKRVLDKLSLRKEDVLGGETHE